MTIFSIDGKVYKCVRMFCELTGGRVLSFKLKVKVSSVCVRRYLEWQWLMKVDREVKIDRTEMNTMMHDN